MGNKSLTLVRITIKIGRISYWQEVNKLPNLIENHTLITILV